MSAFLAIAVIHLLGVMSPGPDFALIVKNSLTRSRATGVYTAGGIALGILVHVAYCLLGIGLVISQSIVLYSTIKWIGALYLLYIGWKALTAKATPVEMQTMEHAKTDLTPRQALWHGFLCNALNPKATVFFLALFTQVIDPSTPLSVQLFYGLYMTLQTFAWFAFLALTLSLPIVQRPFKRVQHRLEQAMGAVLILLGLKVAFSTRE